MHEANQSLILVVKRSSVQAMTEREDVCIVMEFAARGCTCKYRNELNGEIGEVCWKKAACF
jgi:hypothetical protein